MRLAGLAMLWLVAARPDAGPPTSDARFYTRLALGVSDFGVYGEFRGAERGPTPAMEILPLYPLFLAGSLWLAGGDLHHAALPNIALSVANVLLAYRLALRPCCPELFHFGACPLNQLGDWYSYRSKRRSALRPLEHRTGRNLRFVGIV